MTAPPDDPTAGQDPAARASALAQSLRARGLTDASTRLDETVAAHPTGSGLLEALREACQSVLTAVEAVDPSSYAAIEELRLDVDRRLNTGHTSG
jgi:hypothetical protein